MPSAQVNIGDLAFVVPMHVLELSEFTYVRVQRVDGDTTHVTTVDAEEDVDGQDLSARTATIALRTVEASEITLSPGSFVGRLVAFVNPDGPQAGTWARGVVTHYDNASDGPLLYVLTGDITALVHARDPPTSIIKATPINDVLQVGASISDMVFNSRELLQQQDMICGVYRKRRRVILPEVRALLPIPFEPEELVPLVRPLDLQVVRVRRQHVAMGSRKRNGLTLYRDPQAPTSFTEPPLRINEDIDSDDEIPSITNDRDNADDMAIQQQHRILGKRPRDVGHPAGSWANEIVEDYSGNMDQMRGRSSFRPSAIQRQVHHTVVNVRHQGKHPQSSPESLQHSVHVQFQTSPPVLQGLYDFGFGGISITHCWPADMLAYVEVLNAASASADFSEKNKLSPSVPASSKSDVFETLGYLHVFAIDFYNQDRNLGATETISAEFSRNDEGLLELLDVCATHRPDSSPSRPTGYGFEAGRRLDRARCTQSSVPMSRLYDEEVAAVHRSVSTFASQYGIVRPEFSRDTTAIDCVQVKYLSALARQSKLTLPAFERLIRGQTDDNPRPNKALHELPLSTDIATRNTYMAWNDIVRHGVRPTWKPSKPHRQNDQPSNHKIPTTHLLKMRKHIRQGQLEGRNVVLDKGTNDIRVINNYSFPTDASVNDFTDTTDFPEITYNPPRDITSRIHVLRPHAEVLIMLGDVSGAFWHVPIHRPVKMSRAYQDAEQLLKSGRASKTALNKILGVFRNVTVCFPSPRAFYQMLHDFAVWMYSFQKRQLSEDVIDDLRWFRAVLTFKSRFNSIPMEQFAHIIQPSAHVFMDASDPGLCAINPARANTSVLSLTLAAIRLETYEYFINVRELTSSVLAALHWGPILQQHASGVTTHVRFHIDNMSAVSWSNRRLSRQPRAQMLNRLLSLAERQYQCLFTAEHIAGRDNIMADAGSRAWTPTDPLWTNWTNLSASWSQVVVRPPFDNLSAYVVRPSFGGHYHSQIPRYLEAMVEILTDNGLVTMVVRCGAS
ncbi:LOW QUALITY PROTEIN: hypothetical protein PHPALM_28635 [Phytophthora palmivora]|uniref:Uncharacterized protein n=1 Tax=Phytophthora palmivora TaxID=4796 RepID=A0A2P4X9K6_9STRA|nr:LOW QUALITY PROTEIN: hypothetical protein PHPALM_28635 [Phytophthora palmivora]